MVAKHGFKLQKLERPMTVRNVDGTNNSREVITYQVEVNVYYKNHIKRMRIDMCNLGKTDVILDMLQLQVYNLEINQETKEIRITRCLPICERSLTVKGDIEKRKKIEKRVKVVEKVDKDKWKMLMEEKFDDKVELDREKVKKIVPQRFHKQFRYLNKKIVKDNYSLSLISDLINTIETKKVFTKMNLHWGYNNI